MNQNTRAMLISALAAAMLWLLIASVDTMVLKAGSFPDLARFQADAGYVYPRLLLLVLTFIVVYGSLLIRKTESVSSAASRGDYLSGTADLQTILQQAPMLILGLDSGGKPAILNDELLAVFNFEPVSDESGRNRLSQEFLESAMARTLVEHIQTADNGFTELELLDRNGNKRIQNWAVVKLPDGTRIGSGYDLTDSQQALTALRRSEERLNLALESAADGVWDLDLTSGLIERTPQMLKLLGYEPGDLAADVSGWKSIIHPDERQVVQAAFDAHLAGQTPYYESEHRLRTASGDWNWVLDRGRVTRWEADGKPLQVIGTTKDINSSRLSEASRREAEKQFRAIIEAAEDAIFVKDEHGTYINVNPGMERLFGLPAEELVGKMDADLFGLETAAEITELEKRVLAGEVIRSEKTRTIRDRQYHFHSVRVPLYNDQGEVTGLCGISRDITELMQAEQVLARREAHYRLLAENTSDLIMRYNRQCRHLYVNQAATRLVGLPAAEFVNRTHRELGFDPETCETFERNIEQAFNTAEPILTQIEFESQTGRVVFDVMLTPETTAQGTVDTLLCTARDITALKQTEEALRESEERYRLLVETMPDGIATQDADLNLIYANDSFCRMLGYGHAEIVGQPATRFLDAVNQSVLAEQSKRRTAGETGSYELTWQHRKGHDVLALISPAPILSINGRLISSAIITDISARQAALDALRDSEEFSRTVIENSPIGITVRAPSGRLLNYNDAWQQLWQMGDDEIRRSMSSAHESITFEKWSTSYLKPYFRQIKQVFESGGSLYLPDLKTDGNSPGAAWWISHYFYAILDATGIVDRVVVMTEDITARKLAEEALRDSEAFSRAVIDSSPIGITVRTPTGQLLDYNAAWQKLWVIPDQDLTCDMSAPRDKLQFNERDGYLMAYHEEIRKIYELGGSLYLPDLKTSGRREGAAQWVSHYFYAIDDADGDVDRVVVLTEDITERKLAEQEREKLITELRQALADIKMLRGLLPICAHCKKIRDDQGYWNKIEKYISQHADVSFSHGICPDCATKYYPGIKLYKDDASESNESATE